MNTKDAIRRAQPGKYERQSLPILSSTPLPAPHKSNCSFTTALEKRVSAESFSWPTNEELSDFLNDVSGIRFVDRNDRNRQKRCVASMGALHPAHLLVYRPTAGWQVYIPDEHSLGQLSVNETNSKRLLDLVDEHLVGHQAAVICLLSDCDLAENYYEHYAPLLLRDAGVLMGHAALVASAHGLPFRILGRTGTDIAESLIRGVRFRLLATGLALLGSKVFPASPQSRSAIV